MQLVLLLHLIEFQQTEAVSTTIDLTTTYTPISKTTSRNPKTKLHRQSASPTPSSSQKQQQPQQQQQNQHHAALVSSNDDINMVVLPSKSYISQPTPLPPKELKRPGQTAELKQRKPLKEIRNRTVDTERSSKLQTEVVSLLKFR